MFLAVTAKIQTWKTIQIWTTTIKYQIKNLDHIYATAMFAPVFKNNPKYCVGKFQDLTPYIAYDDVMNNKYIIRGRPVSITSNFDNEKREIISSYTSMEELVMDGWRLD